MPKRTERKSKRDSKVADPLEESGLKLTMREWVLYWKLKYEGSHIRHVEQVRAAKVILDQRDAAVRMLNELPKHRILELQDAAEESAKKAGKPFLRGKSIAEISKKQREAEGK